MRKSTRGCLLIAESKRDEGTMSAARRMRLHMDRSEARLPGRTWNRYKTSSSPVPEGKAICAIQTDVDLCANSTSVTAWSTSNFAM